MLLLTLVLPFLGAADLGRAGEFHADIVAVDLSGLQSNLTQNASLNASPAASRDGRIAFVSDRDVPGLYVMDADGGNVRRVNGASVVGGAEDLELSRAAWSPGGDSVAFDGKYGPVEPNCAQHCFGWAVSVADSDGSGARQVALNARAPSWSPDGRRLAYLSGVGVTGYDDEASSVTIMRLDGSGATVVQASNDDAEHAVPVWSPGGRELAFQAGRWIDVVRADGHGKRRLAAGRDPSWSPNGKKLAFIDDNKLMVIDRTGGGERRLSPKGERVIAAAWSPRGALVAYLTGTRHAGFGLPLLLRVKTVSADGSRVHVLGRPLSWSEMIWSGPVWTRDGKRILVALG